MTIKTNNKCNKKIVVMMSHKCISEKMTEMVISVPILKWMNNFKILRNQPQLSSPVLDLVFKIFHVLSNDKDFNFVFY